MSIPAPAAHRRFGLGHDPVERGFSAPSPPATCEQGADFGKLEIGDVADRLEVVGGKHHAPEVNQLRLLRGFRQQVVPRADEGIEREDLALAEGIDRRVGDLGETLPEVGGQRPRDPRRAPPAGRRRPSTRSAPSRSPAIGLTIRRRSSAVYPNARCVATTAGIGFGQRRARVLASASTGTGERLIQLRPDVEGTRFAASHSA